MEAGMEEVLDEMVGPMIGKVGVQKGNNWVQKGGNNGEGGRQAGLRGTPPGNGVCIVCTVRYQEKAQIISTFYVNVFGCSLLFLI